MTNTPEAATPGGSAHGTSGCTAPSDGCSRRAVLRGAAVGGLSLPLLAACGGGSSDSGSAGKRAGGSGSGDSSSGGSSSGGSSPTGSGGGGSGSSVTVPVADVPVGGGTILTSEKVVVTQPTKGQFKAFSAVCTHAGCTVGEVTGGQIVCPCHGSHFSITDGSPVSGPAPKPLAAKTVKVSGGKVSVA